MAKRAPRLSAVPMPVEDRESVSVRRIKNGWIISRSGTRKGDYYSEDEFSAAKPQLLASPMKKEKR